MFTNKLAKKTKKSTLYYIIPMVVPDNGNMDFKQLPAMGTEINATQVCIQDKLMDQVYHYDVTDKVFEKAFKYENRKI